tara:strand:+ start:1173 stop:2042 length:870 start_codon:yes stop_codon:yes gene_type:complete
MKNNHKYSYWIVGGLFIIITLSLIPWELAVNNGPKIGVIEINAPIMESKDIIEDLNYFLEEKDIKAIVVRLNTPGGGVAASQEIYNKIKKIVDSKSKPIIASMGGVAASGGYYVALGADTIVANSGSVTGSIGVIMSYPVLQELMQKIGIGQETIKSGEMKDAGSMYRDLNKKERRYFQELIDDLHKQFINVVSLERSLPLSKVQELADGKVYSGQQAFENGLIDTLGTMEDAIFIAANKANIKGKPVIVYPPEEKKGFLDVLIGDIFQQASLEKLNSYLYPEYKMINK